MLHILLMILKIIGIILLVLFSILLSILLIVMFVPIRYRIKGKKDAAELDGRIRVSGLLGMVAFMGIYQEKKFEMQLKLFGIDLLKLLKKIKNRKTDKLKKKEDTKINEKKETVKNKEEKSVQETSGSAEVLESTEVVESLKLSQTEEKQPFHLKVKVLLKKLAAFPSKVLESIRKMKLTIKNICGKIRYWNTFLTDERTKVVIILVKDHLIKILKHILPKRIKGQIVYGFEDPCTTGQVLAGVSVVYPLYYKHLTICPDFSGAVFNGNVDLKGRIYLAYLVKSTLVILFNKNVRYIIHTFRNKEGS